MSDKKQKPTRTAINQKIWRVVEAIPPGCVATYGQVAELAGLPRGARQVGASLKAAPPALDLPWHRVINAQGKISLPRDTDAYASQKKRLEQEGITFVNGRITLARYGWHSPLDALLWGPP